ncbi:Uncharacterized protein OS=Sphingobium lactosutens DS20 GN=RLDS_20860 PE=4 SV=1 [Gemmata massiliana]|uniref:DUF6891 domain-containing protein n=1 Tax=Gemmata massiliana TaxID=1210884 RepID=A0A6P2CYE6_9BACT|nr:hypothetical protein [Gemmata massiliana]VTR93929.1 Uncharacterized protein OS=Sphingobium lactosutens DS20 GN=RLDS_20860 PE=4 SV=1 [Gemmata massiliana]
MTAENKKFDDAVEYMRDQIRQQIAAGFDEIDRITESAIEVAAVDGVDTTSLEPIAKRFTHELLEEHFRTQSEWPDRTDCDRLDEAFDELEEKGIVCRQNFACCGTCGSAEIWDEMRATRDRGKTVRGYAFYHMQDTDSAVDGGGLYLGYGATEEGEEAALTVARDVISVLNAHGLETDWNGNWNTRIGVSLDWKRRRPVIRFGCHQPSRGLLDDIE